MIHSCKHDAGTRPAPLGRWLQPRESGGRQRVPARWQALLALVLLLVVPPLHSSAQHGWAPAAQGTLQGAPVLAQAANDLSTPDADTPCELCSTLQGAELSNAHHLSPLLHEARRHFGPRKHLHTLASKPLDVFCRPPPAAMQPQCAGVLPSA